MPYVEKLSGSARSVEITASKENKAVNNPLVMVRSMMADPGGTTSLRFSTDKNIADNLYPIDAVSKNRIAPPSERKVQERDRDLGQTFLTGDQGFKVDTVFLAWVPPTRPWRWVPSAVRAWRCNFSRWRARPYSTTTVHPAF